jgi:TatA/E family protein of Tat protein translocase
MPNIGAPELIIILVIALLVLGPGKLPEVGASLGKSIREFRKASTDLQESVNVNVDTSPLPAAAPAAAAPIVAAPAAAAPVVPAPVAPGPVAPAPAAPVEPVAAVPPVTPIDVPAGGLDSGPTAPAPAAPASDSTTVAS